MPLPLPPWAMYRYPCLLGEFPPNLGNICFGSANQGGKKGSHVPKTQWHTLPNIPPQSTIKSVSWVGSSHNICYFSIALGALFVWPFLVAPGLSRSTQRKRKRGLKAERGRRGLRTRTGLGGPLELNAHSCPNTTVTHNCSNCKLLF